MGTASSIPCRFDSPQLAIAANGAEPTFAFARDNSNYLALQGSFTAIPFTNEQCTYSTASAYTPLIVNGDITRTCKVLSGSTQYTRLDCPTVINNDLPAATYTLTFENPALPATETPAAFEARRFVVIKPTTSTVLTTVTTTTSVTATATQLVGATPTSMASAGSTTSLSSIASLSSSDLMSSSASSSSSSPSASSSPLSQSSSSSSSTSAIVSISGSSSATQSSSASSSTQLTTLFTVTTRTSTSAYSVPTLKISQDATCGGKTGYTCKGSRWGDCCSRNGWCGRNRDFCTAGCQLSFGTCNASSASSSSAIQTSSSSTRLPSISSSPSASPISALKVSTDGSCGGKVTCKGSKFGKCCSKYGYCGSSSSYCDAGCNPLFGSCKDQAVPSTTPSSPSLKVSKDAKCGGSTGQTCKNSAFGNCCSQYGWCGSGSSYCGSSCDSAFGDCSNFRRQASATGGGPDFTYPPIPTITATTTVTASITVGTVTVTVTGDSVPTISTMSNIASSTSSATETVSTDTATMTSSSLDTPTSMSPLSTLPPAPTSEVVPPANFCLKVLTPGVSSSGFVVKSNNIGGGGGISMDSIVGGSIPHVMRFAIGTDNILMVTTPGLAYPQITRYSRGTGAWLRFADNFANAYPVACVVKTSVPGYEGEQVLKCIGGFPTQPVRTFTGFRDQAVVNVPHRLFGDEKTTQPDTADNFKVELGLFTGGACPVDAPTSSSISDEATSSLTPMPSVETPSPSVATLSFSAATPI
ncbi:hypothetical protein HBH98_015300 [Parastagonospora nodorum]|nr:hypothetical protein HBH98_015300 [Parastagonospora nodorum]KAH4355590.1 hypothetical protein HBH97_237450 [Parastagonospora nodorum]KAH4369593.1 hypothetical protein HBH99_243540 [Parastagonospora nodorum]KAH5083696.1 hypothetical protein HBH95_030800 [Parastagonospora nodorum]KAH5173360.1 hypothetical protein HBH76_239070 [Parastagonospora nodorum]